MQAAVKGRAQQMNIASSYNHSFFPCVFIKAYGFTSMFFYYFTEGNYCSYFLLALQRETTALTFYWLYRGKLLLLLSIGFTEGNHCSYFLLALQRETTALTFYWLYRGKLLLLLSIGFTEGNYCSYFLFTFRNNEAVGKEK